MKTRVFFAALIVFLGGMTSVVAQTQQRDRDQSQVAAAPQLTQEQLQERNRLRDQLQKEAKLAAGEQAALEGELGAYVANKGDGEQVRTCVRAALENGCKGVCVVETVRAMNRAMKEGWADKEAAAMLTETLREQKQKRDRDRAQLTDQQCGDRLRLRVEERLQERKRDRKQDGTGLGGQKREEREQGRERAGERGGGGAEERGGGGGGKGK